MVILVTELKSVEDGFSWTNNIVKVFLSVIDKKKLAEYYESKSATGRNRVERKSKSMREPPKCSSE